MVASPEIINRLNEERCFTDSIGTEYVGNPISHIGLRLRGWLRNNEARIRVYEDPLFPTQELLLGRKYSDFDAGFILAPYLQYAQTPVVIDPNSFCPRKGLIGRQAEKMVNGGYYTRVVI
jgi:hypothetical protein